MVPHDPPRFLARTPHGSQDIALIHEELSRAGFADIEIETREKLRHAPSARDAGLLKFVTDRATEAVASRHGEGPEAGKIQTHVIVAAPKL